MRKRKKIFCETSPCPLVLPVFLCAHGDRRSDRRRGSKDEAKPFLMPKGIERQKGKKAGRYARDQREDPQAEKSRKEESEKTQTSLLRQQGKDNKKALTGEKREVRGCAKRHTKQEAKKKNPPSTKKIFFANDLRHRPPQSRSQTRTTRPNDT